MSSLRDESPRVHAGREGVRTHDDPGSRLGFPFRAFPDALHDDFRAGHLKPIDLAVILEMIRWGAVKGRRDSCWTTREVIAQAIDRDPRTVQASWARLRERGWIARRTFDGPGHVDPDDPDNFSGSRIYFNWAPGRARGEFDRAALPPPRRKRGRPRKGPDPAPGESISPPGEIHFSPPAGPDPGASISPPPGKSASPKGDLISRGDGGETTTTLRGRAREGDGRADRSSSLSIAPGGEGEGEPVASVETPAPDSGPARARLIGAIDRAAPDPEENRALRRFAGAKVEEIRAETPTPHDHVRRAIEIAARAKLKPGRTIREHAAGTLANWLREGFPPPEAPAIPRPDLGADRRAAAERLRAAEAVAADRDAIKAEWEGLPGPERDAIRAEVERENPQLAGLSPLSRGRLLEQFCRLKLAAMRERAASGRAGASPSPEGRPG